MNDEQRTNLTLLVLQKMNVSKETLRDYLSGVTTSIDCDTIKQLFSLSNLNAQGENYLGALIAFRHDRYGREMRKYLDKLITEARQKYEDTTASEQLRLQLQSLKKVRHILFDMELKDV